MSSQKGKKSYLEVASPKPRVVQSSSITLSRLVRGNSFRQTTESDIESGKSASNQTQTQNKPIGNDISGNILISFEPDVSPTDISFNNYAVVPQERTYAIVDLSGSIVYSRVERLLEKVRKNCVSLYKYHNHRYHRYRRFLFLFFRVPLICMSGLNSFVAVGTQGYLQQPTISLVNAIVSLFCGIITSIELLINLQKRMENELESYNNYYKLSIEIYRFLRIDPQDRGDVSETEFLEEVYDNYERFVTAGNAINMYDQFFLDELELYGEDREIEKGEYEKRTNQKYSDSMKKTCSCFNHCFCL
jgi:hypothetical protein